MLYNMYKDNTNLLYLLFLAPILSSVQEVVKAFEAKNVDPLKLLKDLVFLISNVVKMIVLPALFSRIDPIEESNIDAFVDNNAYLGFAFESKVTELRQGGELTVGDEKFIRSRCRNFLLHLMKQLKQRLPDNIKILEKINLFSVENVLKHQKQDIAPLLMNMGFDKSEIPQIELEYNKLHLVQWQEIQNINNFWIEVYKCKNACGENPFGSICNVAFILLVLPMSNAEVERIFSQLNLVKNKARNKISLNMVNAILCVRYGLKRHSKCCHDYVSPNDVLKIIRTNQGYPHKYENFELISFLFNE